MEIRPYTITFTGMFMFLYFLSLSTALTESIDIGRFAVASRHSFPWPHPTL